MARQAILRMSIYWFRKLYAKWLPGNLLLGHGFFHAEVAQYPSLILLIYLRLGEKRHRSPSVSWPGTKTFLLLKHFAWPTCARMRLKVIKTVSCFCFVVGPTINHFLFEEWQVLVIPFMKLRKTRFTWRNFRRMTRGGSEQFSIDWCWPAATAFHHL